MSTNKIWNLKYVVGNPEIFTKATNASGNPTRRKEALDTAKEMIKKNPKWRIWVERSGTGERILESDTETQYPNVVEVQAKTKD
jgi:hypothetical protein